MKKIIAIIFILLSLSGFCQQGINNNTLTIDENGSVSFPYLVGTNILGVQDKIMIIDTLTGEAKQINPQNIGINNGGSYNGTGTAGINTVETAIVVSNVMTANNLHAQAVIECTWIGTCNSSAANASTFTVHYGTNGTVADGLLASAVTPNAGTAAGNTPFVVTMIITIREVGAAATSYGMMTVQSQGNGGLVGAGGQSTIVATMTNINTTTDAVFLTLGYYSAASTTTSTFQEGIINITNYK